MLVNAGMTTTEGPGAKCDLHHIYEGLTFTPVFEIIEVQRTKEKKMKERLEQAIERANEFAEVNGGSAGFEYLKGYIEGIIGIECQNESRSYSADAPVYRM